MAPVCRPVLGLGIEGLSQIFHGSCLLPPHCAWLRGLHPGLCAGSSHAQHTLCPVSAWGSTPHCQHPSGATTSPDGAFAQVRKGARYLGECSTAPGLAEWLAGWIPPPLAPQPCALAVNTLHTRACVEVMSRELSSSVSE